MDAPPPVRIAMWSGPRNLSTALMRAWASRADTAVVDEPLYAAYLAATGLAHPARAAVLASQPTDWQTVAGALVGPVPGGRAVFYQKHMAHHLLPGVGRAWLGALRHAFLVREPAGMLASLARVTPGVTAADTGLPQQVALFDETAERLGHAPPVVDAADVLAGPPDVLAALCTALGVAFDPAMLAWPAGPHPADGVWAPHWYAAVRASTGFAAPGPATAPEDVPDAVRGVLDTCRPLYDHLSAHRLAA